MYGIGIFEIILVLLVLLLFFKPAEIFSLSRRLGVWYRKMKRIEEDLRKGWDADPGDNEDKFGFDTEADEEGENL